MKMYRLIIRKNGRLVGCFESSTPSAEASAREMYRVLESHNYQLDIQVAREERRIFESTPHGLKLLSSEPIFDSAESADL